MSSPSDGTAAELTDDQLAGDRSYIYYDEEVGRPVVLTKWEGWPFETFERVPLDRRTYVVQHVRCWIADAGCGIETISHVTRRERLQEGRYWNLSDEWVEFALDLAAAENRKWAKANKPAIPYSGDGGVNVYLDGECLDRRVEVEEDKVVVGDDTFEPTRKASVWYDEDGVNSVVATVDGEETSCIETEDSSNWFTTADGEHVVELRLDDDYSEPHP